jgi:hypothetical protein
MKITQIQRVNNRINFIQYNSVMSYSVNSRTSYKIAATVEALYNRDPIGWDSRGVLRSYKDNIMNLLAHDEYQLAPIQCIVFRNEYNPNETRIEQWKQCEFYSLLRAQYRLGHSHFIDDDVKLVVSKPGNSSDLLVYQALAKRLLTHIGCPYNVWTLEDMEKYYFNEISHCSDFTKMYKINFSCTKILKSRILNTILTELNELSSMEKKLIESFVNLQTISYVNTNNTDEMVSLKHIPVIGELTRVIFHIFLIDQFDNQMKKLYPQYSFYRLGSEVIIPIHNDESDIDTTKLLENLNLFGSITEEDGSSELVCTPHGRKVLTLYEGQITVWDVEEYI